MCLVIGATTVNRRAPRSSSPIYGMPIIMPTRRRYGRPKRSMAAGFAGIENELFYAPRTWMLFGDAKQSLQN